MKFNLIAEAKHFWRIFSIQMMSLAIAVQGAWSAFGDDLKSYIPHAVVTGLSMGLLALGIGGRLVIQPGLSQPPQTPPPANSP